MYVIIIDLISSLTCANYKTKKTGKRALEGNYCQKQKTVNTWKISGMLIVYWPNYHNKVQDTQENLKTTNLLSLLFVV